MSNITDLEHLANVLKTVLAHSPEATEVHLIRADPNEYGGFLLLDITHGDDGPLSDCDPDLNEELTHATYADLCNLSWGGIVGAMLGEEATISLTD